MPNYKVFTAIFVPKEIRDKLKIRATEKGFRSMWLYVASLLEEKV